jgi:hypothetical protein
MVAFAQSCVLELIIQLPFIVIFGADEVNLGLLEVVDLLALGIELLIVANVKKLLEYCLKGGAHLFLLGGAVVSDPDSAEYHEDSLVHDVLVVEEETQVGQPLGLTTGETVLPPQVDRVVLGYSRGVKR